MTLSWRPLLFALVVLVLSAKQSQVSAEEDGSERAILRQQGDVTASGSGFTSRTLPANKGVHCVSYYAKLAGPGMGYLKASLTEAASGKTISDEEHVARVEGSEPSLVYFDIPEQKQPFQVVIKKMEDTGAEEDLEISILEAEVRAGSCLVGDVSCDMEKDTCGYATEYKKWWRYTPVDGGDHRGYPGVDATFGSDAGYYLKTKVDGTVKSTVLVSPVIKSKVNCLRFQYAIYDSGKLVVRKGESDTVYKTLANSDPNLGVTYPKWRSAQVQIQEDKPFQLNFVASAPGSGEESKIALDDIKVVGYNCYTHPGPKYHPPPKIIRKASCTFDDEDCISKWKPKEGESGSAWKLTTGESRKRPPYFDHTNMDAVSNFQYVYVWEKSVKTLAVLQGPKFDRRHEGTGPNCFSFWYFMHGGAVPRLSAYYSRQGVTPDALWTREGDQGPTWQQAFVHTPYPGPDVLAHIEFSVTNTVTGSVAIDDVKVYDGPCPNIGAVCDFETLDDMCGFTSLSREWTKGKASKLKAITGLATDHSTQTPSGSYVYIDERDEAGPKPGFKSHMYPPTTGRCLKFYYSVAGNEKSESDKIALDVLLESESGDTYYIDVVSGRSTGGKWAFAETNVVSYKNFQIIFKARPDGGVISLDDIQLSTSACHDSYGCDFEQGLCSWSTNLDDHSNLDWQITAGHLITADETGPENDVTHNTPFGHFLYLETESAGAPGALAVLTSQEAAFGSCLTFYYSMMADGTGSLSVNLTDLGGDSMPTTIWKKSGRQGRLPQWHRAQINIETTVIDKDNGFKNFQLSLIGSTGSVAGANIAVDEIKLHFERCSNVRDEEEMTMKCRRSNSGRTIKRSQVCDFHKDCEDGEDEESCGSCDFATEGSWCYYVQQSNGEVTWATSTSVPSSQLEEIPSRKGKFLLLSRNSGPHEHDTRADLETANNVGPSPPSCQLHFEYFISVEDPEVWPLKVVLRQSDEETVIFRKGRMKRHGSSWTTLDPSWNTATVDLGGIDARFKIAFVGHKKNFGTEEEGNVAFGNIQLKNCEFPPVVDVCSDSEFRCERGSCVDASRVCDFTDDCGDRSDEKDCDLKQYTLRTSFEDGFGDWIRESTIYIRPWTIYQAKEGLDIPTQPTRDHTLGTLNGHFIYTEEAIKDHPARIWSPVMVAANSFNKCHLRLHYYLHANHEMTHLTVSTRTSELGEEKVLFHRYTSHGHAWHRADIQIEETDEPFQIIIGGTSDRYQYGTFLALDDISLWGCEKASNQTLPKGSTAPEKNNCTSRQVACDDGTCMDFWKVTKCDFVEQCPDGSDEKDCGTCDFESGSCGWHDESAGVLSWTVRASSQQREPSSDANTDTEGQGHYVLLKGHSAGVDKTPALLMSPKLPETDPGCQLSFAYYTNSKDMGKALKVVSQGFSSAGTEQFLEIPMDTTGEISPGQWSRKTFNLGMAATSDGGRRIIIKHDYRPQDDYVAVAIDDIKFEKCRKYVGMRDKSEASDALECTFHGSDIDDDASFCNYHPSYLEGNYYWHQGHVMVGGTVKKTVMTGAWDGTEVGHKAFLTSDWINGTDTGLCLHFMYMTFGTQLSVIVRSKRNSYGNFVFSHHSYDAVWKLGQANIPPIDEPFMVLFQSGVRQHAKTAYLAFVRISEQECLPTNFCDFSDSDCGYVPDQKSSWWRYRRHPGPRHAMPRVDHTTDDENPFHGGFMHTIGSGKPKITSITSPVKQQSPIQGGCTYFWYNMIGGDVGTLSVKLKQEGSSRSSVRTLWQTSGSLGDQWLQGRVDISKDFGDYNLVFEAELKGDDLMAVDDIETLAGPCPRPGTCDFDTDMCGYTTHTYNSDNGQVHTEVRWLRLVSDMPLSRYGPMNDHTGQTDNGGYVFSDQFVNIFSHNEQITRMVSPVLPPTKESCFVFWFFFDGRGDGTLRAKIAGNTVFEESSKDGGWRQSTPVRYTSDAPYQVTFESERVGHFEASLAVDDIELSDGPCDQHETHVTVPRRVATTTTTTPTPTAPTTPAPKQKPKPVIPPRDPVPDHGSVVDESDQPDCRLTCKHWKSCRYSDRSHSKIECICKDGYRGDTCEQRISSGRPIRPVDDPRQPAHRPRPVEDDRRPAVPDPFGPEESGGRKGAARQEDRSNGSSAWKTAVAVILTIVGLLVLLLAVFVYLVRTNRMHAPIRLQRMVPYLKTEEGFSNPSHMSFQNGNEIGINNPVYGPYEERESDI